AAFSGAFSLSCAKAFPCKYDRTTTLKAKRPTKTVRRNSLLMATSPRGRRLLASIPHGELTVAGLLNGIPFFLIHVHHFVAGEQNLSVLLPACELVVGLGR